jgi:hypothetical protein
VLHSMSVIQIRTVVAGVKAQHSCDPPLQDIWAGGLLLLGLKLSIRAILRCLSLGVHFLAMDSATNPELCLNTDPTACLSGVHSLTNGCLHHELCRA